MGILGKKSEHNNELDLYNTHIYAYDTSGNSSFKTLSAIPMGGIVANLGSFNARIVLNKDSNYVVGVNNSNVVLKIKIIVITVKFGSFLEITMVHII